jgi:hypothetical protein
MADNSQANDKKPDLKDKFRNELLKWVDRDQSELVQAIILEAKKGKSEALNAILKELAKEDLLAEEQVIPLSDEQYKQIITMAAQQLAGKAWI